MGTACKLPDTRVFSLHDMAGSTMLSTILKTTLTSTVLVASIASSAIASEPENLDIFGTGMSDTMRQAFEHGQALADSLNPAAATDNLDRDTREVFETEAKRGRRIANEALALERDKILEVMGLEESKSQIYYFVTLSMPEALLKSYIRDAIWTGGTVVLRGVTPGMNLQEFILEKVYPLVGKKGAAANFSIDPTLYDFFQVKVAPTIVYSEVDPFEICLDTAIERVVAGGMHHDLYRCEPAESSKYHKISGSVTTDYALELFIEEGARYAENHLSSLRAMVDPSDSNVQQPFSGDWDELPVPDVTGRYLEEGQKVYDTDYGKAIGKSGLKLGN